MTHYRLTFNGRPTGQEFAAGRPVALVYVLADGTEKTQPFPASHPWAAGLQHARMEALGYAVEAFTPPPVPPPPSPPPVPPGPAAVNAERDRRAAQPRPVTVDGRRFALDMDGAARQWLADAAREAQRRVLAGDETAFMVRAADGTDYSLAPAGLLEAAAQVFAAVDGLFKAAQALRDAPDGIPADYAHARHWPRA